ncbi:MAG: DUF2800 domain-containing protein, partial [Gemmatimonadota bacterium]|nr:DUF2800 domain-containing protein [Gemmatimonadota bacterium]
RAGTAAHAVGEMALRKGVDPDMWLGLTVEGVEIDEEMVEAVSVYTAYCTPLMSPGHYWIEHKFSLAALNPPGAMYGTADFVAYNGGINELEVVDYKNGSGVVVEVNGNKQLRYYALGAALTLTEGRRIERVKITVIQPRAGHPDGVIRSETIDYLELIGFANELMEAAKATLDPNAPLHAGAHCRFCPASATCPEQREQVQAMAQVAFEAMPLDVPPAPESLPPDVFADILHKLPILEDWAKAMRAHALRELEAGNEVPGFKLVAKRATRKWVSERQTEEYLLEHSLAPEEIFDRKLKSVAQIEKVVGKKSLPTDLYESKSSGSTLAPAADKRPALSSGPAEAFAAFPLVSE